MRFLILGRSVGLKKTKKTKKNHKKSQNSRPWYPRTTLKVNIHIFGLTKCTIYCEKCSCFCSCFSLCCHYAHFSFQVKNGVTTSLLFFFENAKNLGRSDDGKRRKKRGWPNLVLCLTKFVDTLLQPISKSQKSYLSLKRQM